jgi:hypothetical protein
MVCFGTWLRPKPPMRPLSSISLFITFGAMAGCCADDFSNPVVAAKWETQKFP